jgi:hypothetical protein
MKVITLKEFGDERFVSVLDELCTNNTDRNKTWFPHLLERYIQYPEWFFAIDDEDHLAAFATIQPFYTRCYRVLTRYYVVPKHRRLNLLAYRKDVANHQDHHMSPSSYMIKTQMEFLDNDWDSVFVSFEHINRSKVTVNMSRKLAVLTHLEWHTGEGMYRTCANDASPSCWQNVCWSGQEPKLDKISKGQWITRYGK